MDKESKIVSFSLRKMWAKTAVQMGVVKKMLAAMLTGMYFGLMKLPEIPTNPQNDLITIIFLYFRGMSIQKTPKLLA